MADLTNPMSNPNPGSFMAPAGGGGSSVVQAMQRRGLLPGATNQVSPSAPGASNGATLPQVPTMNAQMPTPPPQPMGTPGGLPAGAVGPDGETPPTPGTPPTNTNPEAMSIINALSGRLKSISKVEQGNQGAKLY